MSRNKFSIRQRGFSFIYAFRGLRLFFSSEHNAWIHFVAVIVVTAAGFYFEVNATEWLVILLTYGLVISLEAVNTAIENLCDLVEPAKSEKIKKIKDIAAGAVLFVAIIALIIGCIIFGPKIYMLF